MFILSQMKCFTWPHFKFCRLFSHLPGKPPKKLLLQIRQKDCFSPIFQCSKPTEKSVMLTVLDKSSNFWLCCATEQKPGNISFFLRAGTKYQYDFPLL